MSKDLMYAAVKAIKIPDIKLKPGRYKVNETIYLEGEVIVGLPTFYQKTPVNIDTLTRLCAVLNCTSQKAIKLFNDIASMSQDDIKRAEDKYGTHIALAEQELRQTLPKKERKGSISGNITVR